MSEREKVNGRVGVEEKDHLQRTCKQTDKGQIRAKAFMTDNEVVTKQKNKPVPLPATIAGASQVLLTDFH